MKIKKDKHGIYVTVDGCICRPTSYDKTVFVEDEKVRGSHPAGPTAYIRRGTKGCGDYVEEMWDVKCETWWHSIEGRGKCAKELREWDRKRNPQFNDKDHQEKF